MSMDVSCINTPSSPDKDRSPIRFTAHRKGLASSVCSSPSFKKTRSTAAMISVDSSFVGWGGAELSLPRILGDARFGAYMGC